MKQSQLSRLLKLEKPKAHESLKTMFFGSPTEYNNLGIVFDFALIFDLGLDPQQQHSDGSNMTPP